MLNDVSALTHQMDNQGRELARAAQLIGSSQQKLEETLETRRRALADLAMAVAEKSADLDNVLRGFTRLIDESLASAEERAREVSADVAEHITGTMEDVRSQFGAIRDATGEERERTTRALRADTTYAAWRSHARRSHEPRRAAASYVESQNARSVASGSLDVRTTS